MKKSNSITQWEKIEDSWTIIATKDTKLTWRLSWNAPTNLTRCDVNAVVEKCFQVGVPSNRFQFKTKNRNSRDSTISFPFRKRWNYMFFRCFFQSICLILDIRVVQSYIPKHECGWAELSTFSHYLPKRVKNSNEMVL